MKGVEEVGGGCLPPPPGPPPPAPKSAAKTADFGSGFAKNAFFANLALKSSILAPRAGTFYGFSGKRENRIFAIFAIFVTRFSRFRENRLLRQTCEIAIFAISPLWEGDEAASPPPGGGGLHPPPSPGPHPQKKKIAKTRFLQKYAFRA